MYLLIDALAWFGSFLFVSGGVKFYTAFSSHVHMIEINQWGLLFIPLMLAQLWAPARARECSFTRVATMFYSLLATQKAAAFICLSFGILHFFGMYQRYMSFAANWDLAIYANACANNLHSSLRNNLSLLADHFEPALALMIPVCKVTDPAIALLASQAVAWSIGAWGIYRLALKLHWDPGLATIAMALYLLFSGHQMISYYDFHLYGWSLATIPWLMYAVHTKKYMLLTAVTLFHLMLKENTGLFIAGFGLWMALNRHRKPGYALVIAGTAAFILVMTYAYPYFRGGVESEYFSKYYGYIGHDFSSFIKTSVTKPWIPLKALLSLDRWSYYLALLAPFLFFPLLAPTYLLPILGVLLINALSANNFLYSGHYHYDAEINPWFFASMLVCLKDPRVTTRWYALVKKLRYPKALDPVYVWFAVLMLFFSGVTPIGQAHYYAPNKIQATLHQELRALSKQLRGCKVAVVDRVNPHMADIPQLLTMDQLASADAAVVAYPQGDRLWISSVATLEHEIAPMLNQSFKMTQPIAYDANFRVWTKAPCEPLQR